MNSYIKFLKFFDIVIDILKSCFLNMISFFNLSNKILVRVR
jgi:hypothetical protein